MPRIISILAVTFLTFMITQAEPHRAIRVQDSNQVDTATLRLRLRQLLGTKGARTEELITRLLVGNWETSFESSDESGINTRRDGETREKLSVVLSVDTFPDGYRRTELILGPAHVVVFENLGDELFRARLEWVETTGKFRERSETLYHDRRVGSHVASEWNAYLRRLAGEHPDLPPLELSVSLRDVFSRLYLGPPDGTFGLFCGYAGTPPGRREAQVKLLDKNEAVALRYVLRAKSVVSRIYAAEGLLMLQREGIQLEETDAALIRALQKLPDMISTCEGCETETKVVEEAFRMFSDERKGRFLAIFRELGYLK